MQFLACPVQVVFVVEGCFSSLRWDYSMQLDEDRVVVGWYDTLDIRKQHEFQWGIQSHTEARMSWIYVNWFMPKNKFCLQQSCKSVVLEARVLFHEYCGVQDLIWYVVHRLQHLPAINWACFLWFLGGCQWNQQAGSRSKRKAGFGSDATESVSQMIATLLHLPGCVVHISFNMNDICFFSHIEPDPRPRIPDSS